MLPVKIKICQCGREVTVCRFFSYDLCFDPLLCGGFDRIYRKWNFDGRKGEDSSFLLCSTADDSDRIFDRRNRSCFLNLSKVPMDAFAVPVGEIYITASRESAFWAVNLCITALAAVTCLYFLSLNTTMTDILGALRKMHMPRLLIELMMLIYRFVFILLHTASAIMTAQEARLGNRDYRTQLRAFGKMLTALFFISLRKANALYDAMEARGYDGTINVLERNTPAKKKEMILLAVFELVLIIVAAAERMI